MGAFKINCVIYPGKEFCGEVIVADLGFPGILLSVESDITITFPDLGIVKHFHDIYVNQDLFKYRAGVVCTIGGNSGYEGALSLCTEAISQVGIGMNYAVCSDKSDFSGRSLLKELILKRTSQENISEILKPVIKKSDVAVIGPGLGREKFSYEIFTNTMGLLDENDVKYCIVDADALFFITDNKNLPEKCILILTPHMSEASHLLDQPLDEIKRNRLIAAKKISEKYNAITVLKGPASITTWKESVIINNSGNPLLATAGSGDVLSGFIASFLCKFNDPIDAVSAAVYVHGLTSEIFKENNEHGFKASHIIEYFPHAISSIFEHTSPLMK
jgi:hydroxyethylthiazole kinase-like uncharacterized protein yjeF